MLHRHLCLAALAAGLLSLAPDNARAAESYDNCSGFIDSLIRVKPAMSEK